MRFLRTFLFISTTLIALSCSSDDNSDGPGGSFSLQIDSISEVTDTMAEVSVSLSFDGSISSKGVCWSLNPNPTINDQLTNEGAGVSSYVSQINGLVGNTQYFIRAYVTTPEGTFYSDQSDFSTNGGIYDDGIILETQQEVEAFGANNYVGMTGNIRITGTVTDLSPLSSLTFVRQLVIRNTDQLVSLSGLENMETVKDLRLSSNEVLPSLEGLNGLTTVTGHISIRSNPVLTNMSSLSGITGELEYLDVSSNSILPSILGLENINSTIFHVSITNNSLLDNVGGLAGLQTVGDYLEIQQNYALISIESLSNLTSIGGILRIRDNGPIVALNGLENLSAVGGSLLIELHDSLSDFCALQNLIINDGLAGTYTVRDNAYNPTEQDIIDGNCSL